MTNKSKITRRGITIEYENASLEDYANEQLRCLHTALKINNNLLIERHHANILILSFAGAVNDCDIPHELLNKYYNITNN